MSNVVPQPSIPENARCVGCGYSLYKLTTDRCPECGRKFDRADPRSMGLRPPCGNRSHNDSSND